MELSFDVETYKKNEETKKYEPILDGTGKYMIMGSVVDEKGFKKVFYNKKEMWDWLIEKGKKARRNGKCVYAWGHNVKYDFFNLFEMDKNLVILAEKPFIAIYYVHDRKEVEIDKWDNYKRYLDMSKKRYTYEVKEKVVKVDVKVEAIRFLDSMNLFKMSLKEVGRLIGLEKLEMPKELESIERKDLEKLETYVLRDSEIVVKAIQMIKEKARNDGVNLKRIMTINQVAISYLLRKMKEQKCGMFFGKGERVIQSKYRKLIRKSLRLGRIEIFNLKEKEIGKQIDGVTRIDCNSLFPYASIKMRFPNLKTEAFYKHPQKEYWTKLIKRVGVSRALMYNESDELGILAIRTPNISYIPKKSSYLLGTWTNGEIEKAIKEGYKIVDVEWSIVYDEEENPFKKIIPELFEKKRADKEKGFEHNYYKSIMNNGFGKFGQIRSGQEIIFDNVEKTEEYLNNNYTSLGGVSDESLIMKFRKEKSKEENYKNYYCPLIYSLITAEARIIMYDFYKKIGKEMIYTDTDDMVFKRDLKDIEGIEITDKLGDFKVQFENGSFTVFGRKWTRPNMEFRLSGIGKSDVTEYDEKTGKIKYRKMQGLGKDNVGEFIGDETNLNDAIERYIEQEEKLKGNKIFIDNDIIEGIKEGGDSITYFSQKLLEIGLK